MPRHLFAAVLSGVLLLALIAPAGAHPDAGLDPDGDDLHHPDDGSHDPSAPLVEHDESVTGIISAGPNAKVTKNLALVGRGERLVPKATTDVWAHDGYAYLGTFNSPCGTGEGYGEDALVQDLEGPGIPIFDVSNPNRPTYIGSIPSVAGSRINDVKVMAMSQGDVLVHSNERCGGGPGGFEVYNVDDPLNPVHLAHVQTDDINPFLQTAFGYTDRGVHNNYLFTRDGRDYNAVQVSTIFGTFQVYDITDPANAELVSWFGAEYVLDPTTDWVNLGGAEFGKILEGNAHVFSGFGGSRNRVLHDQYVTPDGEQAYLAMWDEGLLLVDLGDLDGSPATLISQAIDVEHGSLDGEVNSHSVWPTADGKIVIEGEEDFNAWEGNTPLGNVTVGDWDTNNIPAVGVSTGAGDDFEEHQTGNGAVLTADALTILDGPLAGTTYPAKEFTGSQPKLGDGSVDAEAVWVGRACDTDSFSAGPAIDPPGIVDELENDPDGKIAVVRRGGCSFASKLHHVQAAGAVAMVVANNLRSTPWSGMRIWDYSDPENPVLASIFDTTCSASTAPGGSCDPRGTYSSHNVIVEGTKAYISWYAEGVIVLDIADPYNPVEVARYHESGPEFEERNAGIQDVWGVYKIPDEPWVYASDRNGGLYILKELGAGSAKNKNRP
jgi:hypothetical protein